MNVLRRVADRAGAARVRSLSRVVANAHVFRFFAIVSFATHSHLSDRGVSYVQDRRGVVASTQLLQLISTTRRIHGDSIEMKDAHAEYQRSYRFTYGVSGLLGRPVEHGSPGPAP